MNEPRVDVVTLDCIEYGDRRRVDYGDIDGLVESIKKYGVIRPLAVGLCTDNGKPYRLLAGGRRFHACELAELTSVPIRIYDYELTNLELREIELEENFQRKDLSWQEKDLLIAEINELKTALYGAKTSTAEGAEGWNKAKTAEYMGISKAAVTASVNRVKAMAAIPEIAKCKTADEAQKMLINMEQRIMVEELAKRQRDKVINTPKDKLHNSIVNRYLVGDFFEGIKRIPDSTFDLCEIDPPYAIDLKNMKKENVNVDRKLQDDYNEVAPKKYPDFLSRVINEAYRVLKPTGWIIMWHAPEPWFEIVYTMMKQAGFVGNRMTAKWVKPTPGQSMQPDIYLANQVEEFFYARKSNGTLQRARGNAFEYPPVTPNKKIHPTERPIELIMDVLNTFALPGASIVVPFLGSGNTILAADNAGMKAIGWDLASAYKDSFTLRVYEGEPGLYTSYNA